MLCYSTFIMMVEPLIRQVLNTKQAGGSRDRHWTQNLGSHKGSIISARSGKCHHYGDIWSLLLLKKLESKITNFPNCPPNSSGLPLFAVSGYCSETTCDLRELKIFLRMNGSFENLADICRERDLLSLFLGVPWLASAYRSRAYRTRLNVEFRCAWSN